MAKNQNEEMDLEQEEMTVTLTLDDGSEVECVVLTIFEAGDRDYIALLPTEGAEAFRGRGSLSLPLQRDRGRGTCPGQHRGR